MRCELAKDRIIDRVTGNIGNAERSELELHLAGCGTCRDEVREMETMWGIMANVDVRSNAPTTPLVAKGTGGKRRTAGLIAATLTVGLLGGYATGVSRAPASEGAASVEGGYLALLRQPGLSLGAAAPPETTLVREYGEWAGELAANDQLIAAERLNDLDVVIMAPGGAIDARGRDLAPHISGYFLIRADNLDHARRTVLTMPHLRYGGWIELRETMR